MAHIKSVLKEEQDVHLPEKDVSVIYLSDEKRKLSLVSVRKNEILMASFSIAFTTDKEMNIIYAACTKSWPDGETPLIVHDFTRGINPLILYQNLKCFNSCPRLN
jgi:hypothetical protein